MQEVAKALIREQGITSGHWEAGFYARFHALALSLNEAPRRPAFVSEIHHVVLVRVPEPTDLSVDASTVAFPSELTVK